MPRPPSTNDAGLKELRDETPQAFLRLLFRYGRRHSPILATGVFTGIVARALELLPAFLLGLSLDTVFYSSRAFAVPGWPAAWTPTDPTGQLVLLGSLIGVAYVGSAGLGWLNGWAWNRLAQHMQHEVRTDAYAAMQELEVSFFDERQTGELMSVLNNDVNQLERFLKHGLNMGFRIVVLIGGMAAVMFLLNWQLALIPLLFIPALGLASFWFVDRIYPKYQAVRSAVGELNSRLENNLGGIEVVKAYRREPFERERVEEASEGYRDAQWDAITTRIRFFPALRLLTASGFLATFFVGGLWVVGSAPAFFAGTLTAGTLVTFLLYTRRFMWPMREFGRIVNDHQYAEAASERILGLLDRPPSIHTAEDAIELQAVAGHVSYENVSFAYRGADEPALENIDLDIDPGATVGLAGPTGGGKTTITKLLLRFHDPDEGSLRLDGVDLREADLASLRERVSRVRQDAYLFHGTVAENVAYGAADADRDDVRRAAERAGAHEFVDELPEGYDTMVGERGVKLSGGQRQRIALARALVSDPDVLILDEATSHVDNETEAIIQERLAEVTEPITTIVVAHRLSTVRDADRIVVVDEGRVLEQGTHDELLASGGLYATLWNVQAGQITNGDATGTTVEGGQAGEPWAQPPKKDPER
ncbi:multidrug ABC transporter ATP-binding protein [Thermoplasmatales archaeon SW_10_69_26]|nr:MAG: multidrug ABC transporter ATP-binding protein [Thermoplasmatales archaeon SW_10_69_26]